jgi:hypothetical protein
VPTEPNSKQLVTTADSSKAYQSAQELSNQEYDSIRQGSSSHQVIQVHIQEATAYQEANRSRPQAAARKKARDPYACVLDDLTNWKSQTKNKLYFYTPLNGEDLENNRSNIY